MPQKSTKKLLPLTPRARQIVNFVINAAALGTHDDDGEVGVIAERLGSTPARIQTIVRKLEEQGWVTVNGGFVYPTVEALRWQNPAFDEREARKILRKFR